MTAIIQARKLTKRYESADLLAVDELSFDVHQGECLAVVGESGSGKSTAARMIAGLEAPTSGEVLVEGEARPPVPWPRARRRRLARQIQMVYQDPITSLDPLQTVQDTLGEILAFHDAEADRTARVNELLDRVGLGERYRARRPSDLSGGERQRVAIARALAVNPKILILDEAVSALDVSVQAQVLNLLADLRAELGLTYLFISHDLGVVRQVADRCLVMLGGRAVETADTEDLLSKPEHPYTKRLLEAVPGPGWRPARRQAAVA
ncbi:MAG TPA: ATP-binding cassette domain-containing protein [Actinospica sp.]|jgi:ABC-type glutathione transport system ATPase component|nr:ATP-binding cassette domain-containing protein [Actinospica sp.]